MNTVELRKRNKKIQLTTHRNLLIKLERELQEKKDFIDQLEQELTEMEKESGDE